MRTSLLTAAVAALLMALSCVTGTAVASAAKKKGPQIGNAVAVTPKKRQGTCARQAAARARIAASKAKSRRAARRVARRTRNRVRARCRRAAKQRSQGETSTAPTSVSDPLVVGIDGGWGYWSPAEIGYRKQLGATVTRHEWDIDEPVDEQDEIVEAAVGTIETRIHALLGGNQLGDPGHYRNFVIGFIQRYGPGGAFWDEHPEYDESRFAITSVELGNEPYFGEMSASLYADTVRPALEAIAQQGLPVDVVLPARAYGNKTGWMDTIAERIPNLNQLFDAFAQHPYWYGHDPAAGGAAGPFQRIEYLRAWMNSHGADDKPIWITEYGESTADCGSECISEGTQAGHLDKMVDAVVARPDWGVTMLSVFQLLDRGTDSGDRELQFGLLRENGTPKPVYGIVQGAMQQYRG